MNALGLLFYDIITQDLLSFPENFEAHLKKHVTTKESLGKRQCPICHEEMEGQKNLEQHLSKAHGIKKNQCELCKHVAPDAEALHKHLNQV